MIATALPTNTIEKRVILPSLAHESPNRTNDLVSSKILLPAVHVNDGPPHVCFRQPVDPSESVTQAIRGVRVELYAIDKWQRYILNNNHHFQLFLTA